MLYKKGNTNYYYKFLLQITTTNYLKTEQYFSRTMNILVLNTNHVEVLVESHWLVTLHALEQTDFKFGVPQGCRVFRHPWVFDQKDKIIATKYRHIKKKFVVKIEIHDCVQTHCAQRHYKLQTYEYGKLQAISDV